MSQSCLCFIAIDRYVNKEVLEGLMNKQYVDRVEIVMKETIGVKGITVLILYLLFVFGQTGMSKGCRP